MDLATQLQELRVRAGDPSIRAIERLIARQGRQHPMARSTIQDKISGRSPINLLQVMSIVEALAEHARLNGIPLPQQDIDHVVWRERVAASLSHSAGQISGRGVSTSPQRREIDWDVEALKQAHMFDLVALVDEAKGSEVANWLPKVIRGMMQAEMSFTGFLESAAKDSPNGVARTVAALNSEFPPDESDSWGNPSDPWHVSENDRAIGPLLMHAARVHGAVSSPAVVAGLRRANVGQHVNDYLADVGRWHLSHKIEGAVNHLRVTGLGKDADKLLALVGEHRLASRLLEVVKHFEQLEREEDAKSVLRGVGDGDWYRVREVDKSFRASGVSEKMLLELVRGIPYGRHAEWAQMLKESGSEEIAELALRVKDDPPF